MHTDEHYNMMRNFTIYNHHLVWSEKLKQGECYGYSICEDDRKAIHKAFLWENSFETGHLGNTRDERVT
jgi:hypothetical protein